MLQPDITWVGGLTEARRVVALAAAYDTMVIPHGSSVYSYHLQFAFANCPMGELIVLAPQADKMWPLFGDMFLDEPMPIDGYVTLDENKPGFGVRRRHFDARVRVCPCACMRALVRLHVRARKREL